mgnify:FL=1
MLQIIITINYKGSKNTFMLPISYVKNKKDGKGWSVFLSSSDCKYIYNITTDFLSCGEGNIPDIHLAKCKVFIDGEKVEDDLDRESFSMDFTTLEDTNKLSLIDDLNKELVDNLVSTLLKLGYDSLQEIQLHYQNDFLIIRLNNEKDNYTVEIFSNKSWQSLIMTNNMDTLNRLLIITNLIEKLAVLKRINLFIQ